MRNYKSEYQNYQGSEEQKHNRALRNHARALEEKKGLVHKGDGRDVDHIKPLSRGGNNNPSNWRIRTEHANRSYPRTRQARMK